MPRPSHTFEFSVADLMRRMAAPCLGVTLLAAVVHLASLGRILPSPVPSDLDRTILESKTRLASRTSPVSVLLLGDSSCMMDVDALELAHRLDRPVLNLGTLSYLDVSAHAALLRHTLRHLPSPPTDIVLLVHPGSLLRSTSLPDLERFLRARLDQDSVRARSSARHATEALLGGVIVREQLVQPWIPSRLRGEFATAYGTTWQVQRQLERQAGTLLDPSHFDPSAVPGRYEFQLHARLETASREFRSAIPPTSRFWVGLTPLPESLALPQHATRIQAVLEGWSAWLGPVRILPTDSGALSADASSVESAPQGIPGTLPDRYFATVTHLNADGVAQFTARLATELLTPRAGATPGPP